MITSGPNLGCLCGSSQRSIRSSCLATFLGCLCGSSLQFGRVSDLDHFLGCLCGSSQCVDNTNVLICLSNSELNVSIPKFRLIGNLLNYLFKYRLSGKMVEILEDNSGTEPL